MSDERDWLATNDPVLAILTDLIAELRTAHHPAADLDGELRLCAEGCGITPCPTIRYTDRAEARLRERPQSANERINLGGERR